MACCNIHYNSKYVYIPIPPGQSQKVDPKAQILTVVPWDLNFRFDKSLWTQGPHLSHHHHLIACTPATWRVPSKNLSNKFISQQGIFLKWLLHLYLIGWQLLLLTMNSSGREPFLSLLFLASRTASQAWHIVLYHHHHTQNCLLKNSLTICPNHIPVRQEFNLPFSMYIYYFAIYLLVFVILEFTF